MRCESRWSGVPHYNAHIGWRDVDALWPQLSCWCGFVSCDMMWISSRFLWRWLGLRKNWDLLDEPWAFLAPCIPSNSCYLVIIWLWNPASYVFFLKYHKYQVAWFIGLAERDHKERKVSANDRPDCKRVEIYPVAIIRSTKPQSASAPTSALKLKSPSSKYFANCKRKPIY